MSALWTLLLPPTIGRLARQRSTGRTAADGLTGLDALLAAGLGLGVALVCTVWLAPFTVPGTRALGSPDFGEYCWHVGLYLTDALHEWGQNRSRLAGLPAGLFAQQLGIIDGLLASAVTSLAVLVGGVYLWCRALHGRAAGVVGALLVGAVGPLAVLGRTLTFYPTVTAGLTLACAGAACALRWRTAGTIALAGLGAGLALLIDARGLLWALPAVGIGALAVVVGPPGRWRGLPIRAVALVLPLVVSYQLGSWAYSPQARTLEGHVAIYDELAERGVPLPPRTPPRNADRQYVWGHSDLRHVPDTLAYLAEQGAYVPEWYAQLPEVRAGWQRSGAPWVPPLAGALVVIAWGLRRRPLLLFAVVGTTLPFLVSMQGAVVMKTSNLRFVGSAMVFVPVLLGVAAGVVADGSLARRRRRDAPGRRLPLFVLGALTLAAVLGVPPTWLSPAAAWRVPWPMAEAAFGEALQVRDGVTTTNHNGLRMCTWVLTRHPGDGRLTGSLPGGGSTVRPWGQPP